MKFRKHRLLIYERVHRQRRGLFLMAALALFLVYAAIAWPLIDQATLNTLWLWPPEYDIWLLIFGVIFLLVFLYKLIAPRLTYVQCTERNIRIQTPLFPLFISYGRVTATRPNQWGRVHPPEKRTRRQRRLLEPIAGAEVIVLDLKGWPMPLRWLKLWIPDVMFSPDGDGLVLWVKDWMALNRAFSDIRDRRREEQIGPRPEASLYSRMKR